jgi:hypothetical protein
MLPRVRETTLPSAGVGFETSRGRLGLWTPADGLVIARLVIHGEAAFAPPIIEAVDSRLARAERVRIFFDAEDLLRYDTELRTALTARFFADRARIESLHVLVGSRLVALGVNVANLALRGLVTSHYARTRYVDALNEALSAAGLSGVTAQSFMAA